jgi:5-methylcytosine-specific restriction endonuclease McrA
LKIEIPSLLSSFPLNNKGKGDKMESARKCLCCGNPAGKGKNRKYCSIRCHKDYEYLETVRRWKEDPSTGVKSGGRLRSPIRDYLLTKYDRKCSKCGWCEINPVTGTSPLEVDHINGKADDNREENLRILCPNCHSLTPTWKALNKGNGIKKFHAYYGLIPSEGC